MMTAGTNGTPTGRDMLAVLRNHVSPGTALMAKFIAGEALEARASGATVELSDGRTMIDFGSYAVALLGHRHPAVTDAIIHTLGAAPTSTRILANPAVAQLVADLVSRSDRRLQRVWLGTDGADAVEVSIKLARRVSGRPRILAVNGAFHGKTLGALALTWSPVFRAGVEDVLGHVSHIEPDDATAVEREVAVDDVAALVFEPIQGESGVRPLDPAILKQWASDAHAAGVFVISDEVQVGLSRCGPFSLAIEMGLEPDAVLLGKALGGGLLPLSAMLAVDVLHEPLARDASWHSSTFGGHPLSCAAGTATLRAIDELAETRQQLSERLENDLQQIAGCCEHVTEIRGRGLLWGIELATAAQAGELLLDLAKRGVLVSPCLGSPTTIRLTPPIVTTDQQLENAMSALSDSLQGLQAQSAEASL
jgi:putrescine aminotransferase